eukprot:jgi/Psemu1/27327/gm1.27327_g
MLIIKPLLKAVCNLCFQSSRTKVHPVTNQQNMDAALYVKLVKENLEVVKALGGTLVCNITVSYELENNPLYSTHDYSTYEAMDGANNAPINLAQNNYPKTSVEALDMVTAFNDSKRSIRTWNGNLNNNTRTNKNNNNGRNPQAEDSNAFVQQGNGTTNLSQDQTSQQLLMTAVTSGKDFSGGGKTQYMFLNIGELVHHIQWQQHEQLQVKLQHDGFNYKDSDWEDDDKHEDVQQLFIQSKSEGGVDLNWILLNSESSLNLIANPKLVNNIRVAPNGNFMNIHSNSGVSQTNLIADLPGFGIVWFYTNELVPNVLSLALVSDQCRVTMDTNIDNAIYVLRDGGTRQFQRSTCNLHYCNMRESNGTVLAINTVEGKKAEDMQEILGFPTLEELIKMLDNNLLKICPITRRGIKVMTDIYGKHASIIKGKSPILDVYGDVTLCVDIFTTPLILSVGSNQQHDIDPATEVGVDPTTINHNVLGIETTSKEVPETETNEEEDTDGIESDTKEEPPLPRLRPQIARTHNKFETTGGYPTEFQERSNFTTGYGNEIKAILCQHTSMTMRELITKKDSTSPTVSLYALMLSCMIDVIEGCDKVIVNMPGTFIQTDMPEGEDVYIKPELNYYAEWTPSYGPNMITLNGKHALIRKARKAIYGTL